MFGWPNHVRGPESGSSGRFIYHDASPYRMAGDVAAAAGALANDIDAISALEAKYPGATAAIKAEVKAELKAELSKVPPKERKEILILAGVAIAAFTAFLSLTGHPLQAGEVDLILGGLGLAGDGILNR